jgi:hypothetical protein
MFMTEKGFCAKSGANWNTHAVYSGLVAPPKVRLHGTNTDWKKMRVI